MMKLTPIQVMDALRHNNIFTLKEDAEYQVGIENSQIAISKRGSDNAYLGNTLESAIQLRKILKDHGTKEQQNQINKALADLMVLENEDDWK